MLHSQFGLLSRRRFFPLFLTQFLGAFNDNLFKNALVILITFKLATAAGLNASLMVTAAAGIFILPFFLFSATAGQLADKYDKAWLIRRVKLAEIGLMVGAAAGFYWQNIYFLVTVLFLMGAQSSFFGPLKYGILPDHLAPDELISGNGLIQAATFLAILLGTLTGGLLILSTFGTTIISLGVIVVAVAGWVASRFIPGTAPAAPDIPIPANFLGETLAIVRYTAVRAEIFFPILGVSWFWLVGATFLAQVPTFGKAVLGGGEDLVTLLLLAFSVGIGIGSLLCNRLLRGEVHGTFVPLGALGISVFSVDLYLASVGWSGYASQTVTVSLFLQAWQGWRIILDMLLIAVSGGVFIVPLNAMVQARSETFHRARNIAAVNILNALFMVVSALVSMLFLASGYTVPELFLAVAMANIGVIFITLKRRRE
ncbi:MAG: MFS transporter [Gammaproteobacteria bacterium]|nr:MFS transporter [Gammaproteobacteria bacterium]